MAKTIVIIGGGPGGYVAAIRAAQLGADVHLIEKDTLGGTCLNVGCIPTKAVLHVAEAYRALRHGTPPGIKADNIRLDWSEVLAYRQSLVDRLVNGVRGLLRANKVQVHHGQARLSSNTLVSVDGVSLPADVVILAVGSEPARLSFPGSDSEGILDSTAALNLPQPPKSLVVVGGGVIGVEFASMYRAFGTEVTIVEMLPQILPGLDDEIVRLVREDLVRKGIQVLTEGCLEEVRRDGLDLRVCLKHQTQSVVLKTEKILMSVGRRPRTNDLGTESLGLAMERGRILVDEHLLTNIPNIYAIGDCSSKMMLAHVASAQGAAAAEHALGKKPRYFGKIIPSCVYTHPEIASVGITEEQALQKGLDIRIGRFPLSGNGKALIESEGRGIIKIISGARYGEILGVHLWGPRATDLIAEAALAIRLEATIDELISTIHAHPTIGEAMPEAALNTLGMAIHWPPGRKVTSE